MNGPVRTPRCIVCGCAISDDGPEQSDAWLASMCPRCHEASEHSLSDHVEEYELSVMYEPRSAF